MRNVTSNFLLCTPGYRTGIVYRVIKEKKILKGIVFLVSLAKFFFCCRAKVFLFLENLKCTGVLIFMHHLYFIQCEYKMWASWQKTCNLYSNKQVIQLWWNMLLNIGEGSLSSKAQIKREHWNTDAGQKSCTIAPTVTYDG